MNALEALKKIRDHVGICGNVEELIEETMPYELKELMVERYHRVYRWMVAV